MQLAVLALAIKLPMPSADQAEEVLELVLVVQVHPVKEMPVEQVETLSAAVVAVERLP